MTADASTIGRERGGRVRHSPSADQPMAAVDGNMALEAEGRHGDVDLPRPVLLRLGLPRSSPRRDPSGAALLACPANSGGMRPALMSAFSSCVLRLRGARHSTTTDRKVQCLIE